jgi:hypothetical protein
MQEKTGDGGTTQLEYFEHLEETQGRTPKPLLEAPDYPNHLWWVIQAFYRLTNERQVGMGGVGPIPCSAIMQYARDFELEDVEFFLAAVQACDAGYLEATSKTKASVGASNASQATPVAMKPKRR